MPGAFQQCNQVHKEDFTAWRYDTGKTHLIIFPWHVSTISTMLANGRPERLWFPVLLPAPDCWSFSTGRWEQIYHLCHHISDLDHFSEAVGNQTSHDLYCNPDKHLLIAVWGLFPFHRSSQNSQKMVTTEQQEQQVRKAAALLSFEFRSRCYNLSCKWNCRNDFLPCLHNLLALYLGAQLWMGCPHNREKALSSLPTYQLLLGEMITGWVQLL